MSLGEGGLGIGEQLAVSMEECGMVVPPRAVTIPVEAFDRRMRELRDLSRHLPDSSWRTIFQQTLAAFENDVIR